MLASRDEQVVEGGELSDQDEEVSFCSSIFNICFVSFFLKAISTLN